MEKCCPEILAEAKSEGGLLGKCWMGSKLCEVPRYVHETAKQRKAHEEKKFQDTSRADMESLMQMLGFGETSSASHPRGYFDGGARYDFGGDDYDFEGDQTEVEFLRPDGDTETKTVQCRFFKVEEGRGDKDAVEQKIVTVESSEGSTVNVMNRSRHHNCVHMKKCCPHKLNLGVCGKNFAVNRSLYECSLCYPTQKFSNEEECLTHIVTACTSYPRFSSCQPDTFVMPKPRTRYPCANCGKEHEKWNKCIEHMWVCCPDVILAEDEDLEIDREFSSMGRNAHAADFKPTLVLEIIKEVLTQSNLCLFRHSPSVFFLSRAES